MATLTLERRWNTVHSLGREAFVGKISAGIPPKSADIEVILRFNQGRAS